MHRSLSEKDRSKERYFKKEQHFSRQPCKSLALPKTAEILGMPKTYGVWQLKLEMGLEGD